jgi:type IV pilus assembly protein PilQ
MKRESAAMSRNVLVFTVLVAGIGGSATAAELNSLTELKVTPTGKGTQVVVSGSRAPTFTVFRLGDPDRLVVDVSSADASSIKGHHEGSGPVAGVVASQFSDERASVGRLLVGLDRAAQYDVHADGNRVVITVEGAAVAAASPSAEVVEVAAPKGEVNTVPAEGSQEPNVVATQVDEKPVKHAAKKVTSMTFVKDTREVRTDGPIGKYVWRGNGNPFTEGAVGNPSGDSRRCARREATPRARHEGRHDPLPGNSHPDRCSGFAGGNEGGGSSRRIAGVT